MAGSFPRLWLPVIAWAALIFALSSIPTLNSGLDDWDFTLRKIAHAAEYAILGALFLRATGKTGLAFALGALYAISDEVHQAFVPGRLGSPWDVAIDALGVACGVILWQRIRPRTRVTAVAIDLDGALGDTRPLWRDWIDSVSELFDLDVASVPADRAAAAAELDRRGAGNWRVLLERFSEERAPVYLRRDPAASAALRTLAASGRDIGVFTDAPEPLARVALAQLGADRRVSVLESEAGALERLLSRLGPEVVVIRSGTELLAAAENAK